MTAIQVTDDYVAAIADGQLDTADTLRYLISVLEPLCEREQQTLHDTANYRDYVGPYGELANAGVHLRHALLAYDPTAPAVCSYAIGSACWRCVRRTLPQLFDWDAYWSKKAEDGFTGRAGSGMLADSLRTEAYEPRRSIADSHTGSQRSIADPDGYDFDGETDMDGRPKYRNDGSLINWDAWQAAEDATWD